MRKLFALVVVTSVAALGVHLVPAAPADGGLGLDQFKSVAAAGMVDLVSVDLGPQTGFRDWVRVVAGAV